MKPPTGTNKHANRLRQACCAIALLVFAAFAHGQSGSVETIQFHSDLINATLPYNVVLPPDYRTSKTTRYPVLYLLHGLAGHYSDWLTRTNVADYAAQYRLIVVTPEGCIIRGNAVSTIVISGWCQDNLVQPASFFITGAHAGDTAYLAKN